ncbi:hypothetical protein [Qipengyuania qiaonensis]|uniref:Uncharacterized protein n=1 Tax=Qipengyuania qiaonensis TaxID=2867240 RepID=A0ABS7J5D2_9SPHN|nr:hypothetical protein [Qipengyuania qiaonensis]MBX7481079.1 hypothetical protein [Qipengyuania qiaonensis]
MDKKFALILAGGVLLVVAFTMGEDGAVDRIAKMDAGQAQRVGQQLQQSQTEASSPESVAHFSEDRADPHWFASESQLVLPATPGYQREATHGAVPQDVLDPKLVAASPIQ